MEAHLFVRGHCREPGRGLHRKAVARGASAELRRLLDAAGINGEVSVDEFRR